MKKNEEIRSKEIHQKKTLVAERKVIENSEESCSYFWENNLSDGLPVVLPTEEKVYRMLDGWDNPQYCVGNVPPSMAPATLEKIAINAIMAGCNERHFSAVVSAVEAICKKEFNLQGIQSTTNPVTPFLLFSGPQSSIYDLWSKGNALSGFGSNGVIGRAVRLVMINVGHGYAPELDRSTQGQPAKISFCASENEVDNPWSSIRLFFGYEENDTIVMAYPASGLINILDSTSDNAEDLLQVIGNSIRCVGNNNVQLGGPAFLLLSPEHAQLLAREYSINELQQQIYERSFIPIEWFPKSMLKEMIIPRRPQPVDLRKGIPIAGSPEQINIAVIGGEGRHSIFLPSFGESSNMVVTSVVNK